MCPTKLKSWIRLPHCKFLDPPLLLHTLTELLQTCDYVHVIVLDFAKAFDSTRHFTLVIKLANIFTLPDYVHNWIVHNLYCRQRQKKINSSMSSMLLINASIIQGSALGPAEYMFSLLLICPLSQLPL